MYDLIIVGAGPAGLTASIYASCFHLKHLVIGKLLGGQMQYAPEILNYPGFERISGKELTERMAEQVKKRGGEIVIDLVVRISSIPNFSDTHNATPSSSSFKVETQSGKKYQARSIILATGMERRKLNVPGEVEYTGRGVHYCATCEKLDYAGRICGVVGGANSAVQAAVEIAQVATKVYIIYRGKELRGDPIWLEKVGENHKIEVIYDTLITEIVGDGEKVTGVRLSSKFKVQSSKLEGSNTQSNQLGAKNTSDGSRLSRDPLRWRNQEGDGILPLDKLFIEIGGVPGTALVIPLGVEMDEGGYIKVNTKMATNVAGIFAAGDLVSYGLSVEQISSAVGLGARAAASVFAYIKQEKTPSVWGEEQIRR